MDEREGVYVVQRPVKGACCASPEGRRESVHGGSELTPCQLVPLWGSAATPFHLSASIGFLKI